MNNSTELNRFEQQPTIIEVPIDYSQSAFGGEMLKAIHEFLETHSYDSPLHLILN